MTAIPSVFVSHGAPTLALEDSSTGRFLDALGPALPRPRAIVIASAHFATAAPTVTANAAPSTIHDFGGFPAPLYQLRYPAPGDATLAARIVERLQQADIPASADRERGLDHGAWVPLLRMFPKADIPVVSLSVQPRLDARHHWRVGRALAGLRDEGVLVIGSGGLTHNLGALNWSDADAVAAPWARAFAEWMGDKLEQGDVDAALDWARQAPYPRENHPTTEHLLPLFVALGAGGEGARGTRLHRDMQFGSLALDAYRFAV